MLSSRGRLERRGVPSGEAYEERQKLIEHHDSLEEQTLERRNRPPSDPDWGSILKTRCPWCGAGTAYGTAEWARCQVCAQEFQPPYDPYRLPSSADVQEALKYWSTDSKKRAVSCANCQNCIVSGPSMQPRAKCGKGHGPETLLYQLIRVRGAVDFIPATECPDFVSMSDEEDFDLINMV